MSTRDALFTPSANILTRPFSHSLASSSPSTSTALCTKRVLISSQCARYRPVVPSLQCRVCGRMPETLSHVLNHCLPAMDLIRARHNSIVDRIVRAVPAHLGKIFREQPPPGTTGDNRPDLTIISHNDTSAILVDVTCPFEGSPSALEVAAQAKLDKYEPLRQTLLQRYQSVQVYPFVVGSLGSWYKGNDAVLSALHVGYKYARLMRRLCVVSAISGSQHIWYSNMCHKRRDTNYRQRPPLPDSESPVT